MDHSVKAMNSHRKVAFSRLLNRRRFENDELENLFQRYNFKLQQGSVASVLALGFLLSAVLAALSFVYVQQPTLHNVYHVFHCLVFAGLLLYTHSKLMQDTHVIGICTAIVIMCVLLSIASLPVNYTFLAGAPQYAAADGVWQIVFVIFLFYAMLPLRLYVATLLGFLLPILHCAVAFFLAGAFSSLLWRQMVTNFCCGL
uniref:Adenylate cyclase N-terminal domain-containing protein n=1 Tax=Strigamia maritima TaxID=126957 RepID=T1JLY5_STRMM